MEQYRSYLWIECPSLDIQKEIVRVFNPLDNRISLLRETNTTLEAIAQTLFKSWFVDFDPVKAKAEGRLPEGMDEAVGEARSRGPAAGRDRFDRGRGRGRGQGESQGQGEQQAAQGEVSGS